MNNYPINNNPIELYKNELRRIGYNYNFDDMKDSQIKAIYNEIMKARKVIIDEMKMILNSQGQESGFIAEDSYFAGKSNEVLELELEQLKFRLQQEKRATQNIALGDNPVFDNPEWEIRIPKEKTKKIVEKILTTQKRNDGFFTRMKISKEAFEKEMKKYLNLDKNYEKLTSLDFERLIVLFNQVINQFTNFTASNIDMSGEDQSINPEEYIVFK